MSSGVTLPMLRQTLISMGLFSPDVKCSIYILPLFVGDLGSWQVSNTNYFIIFVAYVRYTCTYCHYCCFGAWWNWRCGKIIPWPELEGIHTMSRNWDCASVNCFSRYFDYSKLLSRCCQSDKRKEPFCWDCWYRQSVLSPAAWVRLLEPFGETSWTYVCMFTVHSSLCLKQE